MVRVYLNSLFKHWYFLLLVLAVSGFTGVSAQIQFNYVKPIVLEQKANTYLEFEVMGLNLQNVQDVFLNYKFDNGIAYQSAKAEVEQNKIKVTFSTMEANATQVQYYLVLNLIDDQKILYPSDAESADNPITVTLVDPQPQQANDLAGTVGEMDFTVLSPLPGEEIVPEDALVAFTLFYNEGEGSADSVKIIFDGVDVSDKADITPYLVTYIPENLLPGNHSVELTYSFNGKTTTLTKWDFPTLDPNSSKAMAARSRKKWVTGQVELSARNQNIFGVTDDIYKSSFRVSGSNDSGWFRYSLNGMLTSQESPRLQPQNRYGLELYAGDVFELQAGHIFPTLNPLMLAGNRIYGVNTALHLWKINAQITFGELKRAVNNLYSGVKDTSIVVAQNLDGSVQTEQKYALGYEDQGIGTYRRSMLGARLGLGGGENFQWGLNAMRVIDRTSSINELNSYNDVLRKQPSLLSGLNSTQKDELSNNQNLFLSPVSGSKPKSNFIFATDLTIKGFNGKFSARSDFGLSLLNNDISTGTLNKARAEELNLSIPDNIANILDNLSWFIIINENMSYLPLAFTTDADGNSSIKLLKNKFLIFDNTPVPTALLASQNSVSLNFFGNSLTAKYQWVGPEYQTLANTALRRDIDGFSITDRFRLVSNTVYVTLGYDQSHDNLIGNKESTTQTKIMNGDVSWYPINPMMPRVSVGYRYQTRENGVLRTNPYLANSNYLNAAIRNVDIINGKDQILATPKDDNTAQISFSISKDLTFLNLRNDFTLSYLNLKTKDKVYAFGDFDSDVYSFAWIANWILLPLRTNLNFIINSSNGSGGLAKVDIVGLNLGATYFLFNDKLSVNGDIAITSNTIKTTSLRVNDNNTPDNLLDDYYDYPKVASDLFPGETLGDFHSTSNQNTYIVRAGATYNFYTNHSLMFDASYTNVSVKTRGLVIPNDHLVQLRYVYRF